MVVVTCNKFSREEVKVKKTCEKSPLDLPYTLMSLASSEALCNGQILNVMSSFSMIKITIKLSSAPSPPPPNKKLKNESSRCSPEKSLVGN